MTDSTLNSLYQPNQGLTIHEFVRKMAEENVKTLNKEYEDIRKQDSIIPSELFKKNMPKNRYRDIICVETNMVSVEGEENTYIHANYVHGYKQKKRFICTQGPLSTTTIDFWRMVWQEQSTMILCLTKLLECGREKCALYWPAVEQKALALGGFMVLNREIQHRGNYEITLIRLKHVKTKQVRFIYHLIYLQWPDFGTPTSSLAFQKFLDEVNNIQSKSTKQSKTWTGSSDGPPIIVHCSAGVGRTGTLIALDICRRKLLDTGKVDLKETVVVIRKQRAHAVQRPEQYVFLALAVMEFAIHYMHIRDISFDLTNFLDEKDRQKYKDQLSNSKNQPKSEKNRSKAPAGPSTPTQTPVVKGTTQIEVFKPNDKDVDRVPELYPTITPPNLRKNTNQNRK